MANTEVKAINIAIPIKVIGKIFTGDYKQSPAYVTEIQNLLTGKSVPFFPNKVMGVYYDNPLEKRPENLKSFQGVFPLEKLVAIEHPLIEITLEGNYLYTKVSGDPVKSVYDGYSALFDHIQKNNITLRSTAGYQVSTYEDKIITTEIYMQTI